MFEKQIRLPLLALFLISFGGLLLHLRIHLPSKEATNLVPLLFGVITAFVLPFMFNSVKTVELAYYINLTAVIIGTIGMTRYSITNWQGSVTLNAILLQSTFADILILSAKLPIAHIIMRYWQSVKALTASK